MGRFFGLLIDVARLARALIGRLAKAPHRTVAPDGEHRISRMLPWSKWASEFSRPPKRVRGDGPVRRAGRRHSFT